VSTTTLDVAVTYSGDFLLDNYSGNNAILDLNGETLERRLEFALRRPHRRRRRDRRHRRGAAQRRDRRQRQHRDEYHGRRLADADGRRRP
jgi:hypothetical protein